MYSRTLQVARQSFFLLGPRGVGKTAWLKKTLGDALFIDLLHARTHDSLLADPSRLDAMVPEPAPPFVVIDEIQRVPALLNEVHRLIEGRKLKFALTGSSARKLKGKGVNLLAGRALSRQMHPLTIQELGDDFSLPRMLASGGLPQAYTSPEPLDFLHSYVSAYLKEEVQQEGLVRNMSAFARFLEAASFSQGCPLNMAEVARDCAVNTKTVEGHFQILEDLLIAVRLPVFTRRAKRKTTQHPKFFFFDAGVFRAIRPQGPLDSASELNGPALETILLHHLRATNDYGQLGYTLHHWRTPLGQEVDFVAYGPKGFFAFEVKHTSRVRAADLDSLKLFKADYPQAHCVLASLDTRREHEAGIDLVPFESLLADLPKLLKA